MLLTDNSNLKRKLGWLEASLFIGGLALLVVFFQVRASSELQRSEGVRAFLEAEVSQVQLQNREGGPLTVVDLKSPDQGLWAEQRVIDYEKSRNSGEDLPLAVLTIEKLGIQVPVYNGTDEFNLNRGVGRIKGTAAIDGTGNLGIAGHRDGFFRTLEDIVVGDEMELLTTQGNIKYKVSSIQIVDPSDGAVLDLTTNSTINL